MRITCTRTEAARNRYVPIPIGNGELSLQIDFQGAQFRQAYCGMTPGIRRAGFRDDTPRRSLVPLGWFDQELPGAGEATDWSQTLDLDRGMVETRCIHENGLVADSELFCHFGKNLIAIRKRFSRPAKFVFTYHFDARRVTVTAGGPGILDCAFDLGEIRQEQIALAAGSPGLVPQANGHNLSLAGTVTEAVIFLTFGRENRETAEREGFGRLLESHAALWRNYNAVARISIPSKSLEQSWRVSQYLLKISATRWSVPTGLFDTHWHGRFFGFDEYFIEQGLLSSGHLEEAARIPEFRASLLESARFRAGNVPDGPIRYPWETTESGKEGSPPGYWYEHIFHHANIALGCFDYFRYTKDLEFLRRAGYPVIRGCALLYERQAVYRLEGGRTVIGKCTDLERLGPYRENAFMTTCSAIALFRRAAETAELLGTDTENAGRWRRLAEELKAALPRDRDRYLPYPGCSEPSIGTLAGFYPYPVLAADDPPALAALEAFRRNRSKAGNMYQTGSSVCAWYRCWEALALLRARRPAEALEQLELLAAETGCFGELFEIHECGKRPWFTTAAGVLIHAVNTLLLPDESGNSPALEAGWRDFAFKLRLPDRTVEAAFRDGRKQPTNLQEQI